MSATSAHAAFQLTVSTLVYPALTRVPPLRFPRAHDAHSRAIVPLVVLVYGAVVVGVVGALVSDPTSRLAWLAALATAAAFLVTAVRAAPLHTQLGRRGPEPDLLVALVRADRVRTVAALLAAAAAVAYGLTS